MQALPQPGAPTTQPKMLSETRTARSYTLEIEAQGGSVLNLPLRRNAVLPHLTAEGASLHGDILQVGFPQGTGYQTQTVVLRW